MNGGNNSFGNLGTLCDDCHTEKTAMDKSLRRKRERVCKNLKIKIASGYIESVFELQNYRCWQVICI